MLRGENAILNQALNTSTTMIRMLDFIVQDEMLRERKQLIQKTQGLFKGAAATSCGK